MTFAGYQNNVYLNGLAGHEPTMPFDWRRIRAAAEEVMSPEAVGYVSGGAGTEVTMRANREAFDDLQLGLSGHSRPAELSLESLRRTRVALDRMTE